uniref:Terminal uridylyltransferase 7 n=1 Tax=Aceria tosichella TaxID=561515 RepID=A0A6G1SEB3_9ACAR
MDRRQASSSSASQLTSKGNHRRPYPDYKRKQMHNANVKLNSRTFSNANDVTSRDQFEPAQNRQQRLAFKDSILNGSDEDNLAHSSNAANERTYSSRNIIASNFDQRRQSEKFSKPANQKSSAVRSETEEDPLKRRHLSYDKMINPQEIDDYITPFLHGYGLDDARNYGELESEYFVQEIGGYTYCALCCQRFPKHQLQAHHSTYPRHVDMFLKLRSKLLNTTPGPETINMLALQHFTRTWINDNALTSDQTRMRMAVVEEFCEIVNEIDPQCQCRIIGSFSSGAALVDSDVNLELLHPSNELFLSDPRAKNSIHHKLVDPEAEYGNQINNHAMHYDLISNAVGTLHRIATIIDRGYASVKSFKLMNRNFCLDLNAKVPRLVLIHKPTDVKLEIWCYAESSHQLACLLKNYMSLDERVLELSILVKRWASICNISNPRDGSFTPETFIILVIHFLQRLQPPVLPCLHELFSKNDDKLRKRSESVAEESTNLDKVSQHDSNGNDEQAQASRMVTETVDDNVDVVEDETEEENEEEVLEHDFDQATIDALNWKSENIDPVHKLFVDFLKFSMTEFAYTNQVVSIRSLRRISVKDKKWNTDVKPIENPVKPSVNLSKNICSLRTFDYIKRCFSYGYYYLTSIPMTEGLRRFAETQNDPTKYIRLYMNLKRFDFYIGVKLQKIMIGAKGGLLDEMIQQNLFARDVAVIKELVEFSILNGRKLDTIPATIAKNYDRIMLLPYDKESTLFCWLCRHFGHTKNYCQKRKIMTINDSEIDPELDAYVNFDEAFLGLYSSDMISPEKFQKNLQVVSELRDVIHSGTGLDCELELFGSTVNLLGSHDSDLDICMTLRGNPSGHGVDCVKILKKTCKVLYENEHVKNTIEPILAARVPIIKFKYDNFDVDLSMYNQCAIHNSKLLRSYVLIDLRTPQLCYLVKQYAKACGIADASRGSLSSYAWSLMVIHFLQHTSPPILPVLQETSIAGEKPIIGVNGWNVWFDDSFDSSTMAPNDTCLTTLFKEFLLYYARFDFNQYVISIRTSKLITKFQKNWTCCMMAIEDPFELTYNLSGRLDDSMALYIMNSFPRTFKHINLFQKNLRRRSQVPTADILRTLFRGRTIMGCEPPYRGCRLCHRIGHRVKDCPEKIQRQARKETVNEVARDQNTKSTPTPNVKKESKDGKEQPRKPKKANVHN